MGQDRFDTPDWVAQDMVEFFKPDGVILDPCRGGGVFLRYLPSDTRWCEIDEGCDFYEYLTPVDWIIGNPPYSQFGKWVRHSMAIAREFAYLIPIDKPFVSYGMMETVRDWGGIKHIRAYGGGSKLGFPIGFAIGAVHWLRDYQGDISLSWGCS